MSTCSDEQRQEQYSLYCGDCLQLMQRIPSNSVDMVLCDLPYGCTRNTWDKPLDLQHLWAEYKRVVRMGGLVALFAKQRFTIELVSSNLSQFKYKLVWDKQRGTDFLNARRKPLSAHEDICIFYSRAPVYNPQMRRGFKPYVNRGCCKLTDTYGTHRLKVHKSTPIHNDGERMPFDVVSIQRKQEYHRTAKPVELLEWLIKTYTNEGMTVLDNCMGSGSTGVACINTRRRFIGIELNREFYDLSAARIAQAAATPPNLIPI